MVNYVKIVVFAPESHVEIIRKSLADNNAGKFGNYDSCCFISEGYGYWRPLKGSNPSLGELNKLSKVKEYKIEAICKKEDFKEIIKKIREIHPYEEPAIDVISLLNKMD